ncbi:glycosyltransferase [Vulgatibacter sp.]|uniref:glycosyltransferase n=1 Tax=Vulgatibacter sp. TaxID=1971226 RepID=UPI0035655BEF
MKRRVLFLTTELPWPVDGGGKLRTFETLACLSRFAEVEVLSVVEEGPIEAQRSALAAALPGITVLPPVRHPVRIRRKPLALARTALAQLLHAEPYLVAKFRNRSYLAAAEERARLYAPDVIWCDHLNVFPAAARASAASRGARVILDEHNVESDLFARAAGASSLLARAARLEGRRAAGYEARALRAATRTIAISPEDAVRLSALGGGDRVITCLPSVGDLGQQPPTPPAAGERVVFLGTLSWPPNAEAARFLGVEILPRLRHLVPGAVVVIGGRGLAPALERELRGAGVELAGYVADPTHFLRSGAVAAVPLRSGSGIAMKLLDSLRAGVPTVSTTSGARGLAVADGKELLLADDADGFAAAIARLLRDEALRARLVAGAHDYLLRHHSRQALAASYAEVIEGALDWPAAKGSARSAVGP